MRKTRKQYRLEALKRVLRLNRKKTTQLKKTKSTKLKYFTKVSTGNYLIQMIKQEKL